ncbi:nesprin-2 [Clinocottus analis]|uniref:nesprin-2 n=1 Tax=Clinocottus analis TaxID=304258 RepID=UPI0035C02AD5
MVEQEQIQKKTFTNWVNAQLAKRRPPCVVLDLFNDFRDGSKLLDLLEVMSGQRLSRERGRGMFQHRSNIEKALSFLKQKSIKLVNINIPDIIDGKPSIILGLIWTIILQYHIEELASSLSFSSRQSSMESLASLDSRSTLSGRSAASSPVPRRGSPLHNRFRVSAKKALLLWVREQCHKAGCSINVKDFKASWRSGVVFLAIQFALRPDLVDLSKARTRSNRQNLEEAFRIAERELRIPRLLDPDDVDVRDPDEKSIMTYVAQFLQYSKDLPAPEEDMQATPTRKAQEVTCWLSQAYEELLEGWDSTEGESYSERYHVFQTFLVSFNEQRRPIMPLLTAMRRTPKPSEEQRALREAWDALAEKLHEYKVDLDTSLPAPLDSVARWLLKTEKILGEEDADPQDHGRAAAAAREKQELLKVCLEEMPQHVKTFQSFQNLDECGNLMVPADKMDELKRRFTSVRVTAKYHGIKLEYWEQRHAVLDLLGRIQTKLRVWKRPYISPEAVRVLLQEWHDLVNTQELPSLLNAALHKLKQVSEKYGSKSALAADFQHVSQQVKQLEEDTASVSEGVTAAKSAMGRVLSAWDSYSDGLSSLQAWLEQSSATRSHGHGPEVPSDVLAEWGSRQAHLNEMGNFLMEATDPQTSRSLADELRRLNTLWAEFVKRNAFDSQAEPSADVQTGSQDLQALIKEATLILKEPLEATAGPLRTYRKRIQFIMRKMKGVDLEALAASPQCPADQLEKLKLAVPEVIQTLLEAEQVCTELQHSVSGLDSRLAELLYWETEARELYQLLRTAERQQQQQQQQRGQDPRARVLISRGLQLEGQVVTEEQDLQMMVMTNQKTSPIQYLHASAMQDRVRAAVAQSQEAVGMLSSLGARRDRSRSPPEGSPPSKVFKQTKEHLKQSDSVRWPTQQPDTNLVESHGTFVPKIVVQEHSDQKATSPTMPYSYAQAVMQTGTRSPTEVQVQAWVETTGPQQQQTQEQGWIQQQEQLNRQMKEELKQQKVMQPQPVHLQGSMQTQQQQQEQPRVVEQQQQVEIHQQQVVTDRRTSESQEQPSLQQPPGKKTPLSSQELQSRKTQSMKNRPWLQKPVSGTTQETIQTRQTQPQSDRETSGSVQVVSEHTATAKPPPEKHAKATEAQQQKQTRPQNLELLQQQQPHDEQWLRQQEEPQPTERHAQPDSKAKSPTVTMTRPQTKAQKQPQPQTIVQSKSPTEVQMQSTSVPDVTTDGRQALKSKSQTVVSEGKSQPQGPMKTQPMAKPQTQQPLQQQVQSETYVPAGPQPSMQPQGLAHGPAVVQMQTWGQVRPSSPMQAPLQGQIQPKVPSNIQLRGPLKPWAPLGPPSPKSPTRGHPQTHPQSMTQSQTHPQSMTQSQTHPQSMTHPQTHPQSMAYPQAQLAAQHQGHPQSMTQYPTHAQPEVQHPAHMSQGQLHAWSQVRVSSPMSVQHLQGPAQPPLYPQGYSQSQSPSQLWTPTQEPQNQAIAKQSHPIPQTYPQQIGQAPQSQAYPGVQALPQWAQAGPQQVPQVGPLGYTQMGPSYTRPQMQAQTQPWTQTQPQIRGPNPMQQQSQMSAHSLFHMQTQQGQVQQQAWVQAPPHLQPQTYPQLQSQQFSQIQHQTQRHPPPQMQAQIPPQLQPPNQAYPHLPAQPQLQPQLQAQSQAHIQTQSSVQVKPQAQQPQLNLQFQQPPPQPKHPAQFQQTMRSPTQPKVEALPQFKPPAQLAPQPGVQSQTQSQVPSPTQPKPESLPQPLPERQLPLQPTAQSPIKAEAPPQPKPQAQTGPLPKAESATQPKVQSPTKPNGQTPPQIQSPPRARPQTQALSQSPQQPKHQQPQTTPLSQINVLSQSLLESPDLCIKPPPLAQAPPQAYTEAYAKAQALARNGFEEAKHCLQEHILETINIFKDKCTSAEQASVKEETLKTLDPELLEEFLRAAKGMEAFCTPPQLRDMEGFTQSVRTQWEACFSEEGSFAQAGQHLEALNELCDTLSPEDAHRLAQTQLRECETRLAAIQRQFSGDQDAAPLPDPRFPVAFTEDVSAQKEPTRPSDKPQVSAEVFPVTMKPVGVERREVEKQPSGEEEVTKKEALERYENCKRSLQAQLAKNEQSIKDVPSDAVSLTGLHTRLQEIQFLRQETESLWSEYANQCSQLSGTTGLEQEKAELGEQWRGQQSKLQRRGSSLGDALRQIDSTENHMVDFTDRLDRYLRQPKDITAFTLANTNILKDIKELDDNIQSELDQLSRLDPESSDLDPRDCLPLSREVETHRASLDQLRQQVRKSEAAARALDRFLMSLRTVDEDVSGVQGAPCGDAAVLQDRRSKLALIRQSVDSLKEKAPQLDALLQGARLTVTREGVPASCLDMVTTLLSRLEGADGGLAGQQRGLQKETQSKSLGLRKRTLLGELRALQESVESQGLKEPTIPAVQHRLRALSDLEAQLQTQRSELQNLRELHEKQGGEEHLLEELETQWKEVQRAFSDRKKQCGATLELLKTFQSCRTQMSNTMQKAEQTISEQASYLSKDNLQRSIVRVREVKQGLGGVGVHMDELRAVCRQLQTQLKKFPDCSETPFEAEADALMDNWLDVTEKTDAYMDNLQVGLELWDKQLMLGEEVDGWAGAKLSMFSESHPFHNEQQVLAMRDEIHANEDNVEHFHKKSVEIQKMLQSPESPLELQVTETQLRKRMEQVKELFADCTDVFEELVAVKKHLAEKMEECQSAVEGVQGSVSKVDATEATFREQIQRARADLEAQEQQAEAVLAEVGLVSKVASPQLLEALSADGSRLEEAIARTKDMIQLKEEEKDKGLLKVLTDERQSFEVWFQDLQLSVNECFEQPESRADVETSLQRLAAFLKSKDAERRLEQLKEQLQRGGTQVPPQQLSEISDWLAEQQKEVGTFRAHCLNRQQQLEPLLSDLNSLQKQHSSFSEWLQNKEKQSAESHNVKLLLKDLQDESGRADDLGHLLASLRSQGVRTEVLLKDGDNLIQRYRNLQGRLQGRADAHAALEGECERFAGRAESTRAWIADLARPRGASTGDAQKEETKQAAQAVLDSKPEGDSKVNEMRRQSESLCEREELEPSRKQEVQQALRETEEQWRTALRTAEGRLGEEETRAALDKDLDAVKAQNEAVRSWIGDQEHSIQSLGGRIPVQGKLQVAKAALSSRPEGDSKLGDLKQRVQSLCGEPGLDHSERRELQDAVEQTEERWRNVLREAEEALAEAEAEAKAEAKAEAQTAAKGDVDVFKSESDGVRAWIQEQKQKLMSLGSHMPFEERLQVTQAVLTSKPEGESKVLHLTTRADALCERLQESGKLEVRQSAKDAAQRWASVLQAAGQAELRTLSDDFDAQTRNTQSWIRDRQRQLQAVGEHTPPDERRHSAQNILSSKPDGDCTVNNLRRRGQSLCDHRDVDQGRKIHVQKTIRDTEEQWRTVLLAAKQVEGAAANEITQKAERRTSELSGFDSQQQDASSWLTSLQQQLDSLESQSKAEDRRRTAQTLLSSRAEGDAKLQALRTRAQSAGGQDLTDAQRQDVQRQVDAVEERWTRILRDAREAADGADKQCAMEGRMKDYEAARDDARAWLQDKQQSLVALESQTDPEETISTAQTILSRKPEGDSKLSELRRQSQSLSDQEELEEEARRAVRDSEEQWTTVLQAAESTLKKAEVQYSLARELEAFRTRAASTNSWVTKLQQQAGSRGSGARGSQAQIEDRLNTAQAILSSKSRGEAQVMELRRRAESLCEQSELQDDRKLEVEKTVEDGERQWRAVLQAAEETQRELQGVVERMVSCQYQRGQAETRLSEFQKQASGLPRVFPWPGLGERRQAVEQARTLLDQSAALASMLAGVRTKEAELLEITKDPGWSDPTWAAKEESIPPLLKELTDAVVELERGIQAERQCTQLVEQHGVAQDWLREHVKAQGAPPEDRLSLHNAVNTLKALLQTVDREQRDMKELDSARDSLLTRCTPGGRDALTLEVGHLHDLCAASGTASWRRGRRA